MVTLGIDASVSGKQFVPATANNEVNLNGEAGAAVATTAIPLLADPFAYSGSSAFVLELHALDRVACPARPRALPSIFLRRRSAPCLVSFPPSGPAAVTQR